MDLVLQIGSALRAAHRAGVVHRDLKPDNIFLCPTDSGGVVHNRIKILDFGISKIRGSQTLQTQESILIGTPQYMSPEQASGKNQTIDQRTDVFALGAIVYEMLSGRPAFSGDSVVAVIMDVVQGIPTPLASLVPSLPPEVDRAIARALAKRPEDRFAEIGDFVTALTGRTLQTLGSDARGSSNVITQVATLGGGRPLSGEEMVGETIAPPPSDGGGTAVMAPPATSSPPTLAAGGPHQSPSRAAPTRNRIPLLLGIGAVMLALIAAGIWVPQLQSSRARPPVGGALGVSDGEGSRPKTAATSVAEDRARAALAARAAGDERAAGDNRPQVAAPDGGGAVIAAAAGPAPGPQVAATVKKGGANHPVARAAAAESIPPEVAAQLAEADRLLAAGDAGEAIRKARQSFFTAKTDRGWALLARAFCAKGDLENAKASLRNLRPGAAERVAAVRACKAHGIDLR
jgi:serine/threonine-protein kinase